METNSKLREAVEVCLHTFQTTDWTTLGTSGRVVDLIQRCKSALAAPVSSVPEVPSVLSDTANLRDALASLIKSISDFVDRVDFYGIDSYYLDCYDKQKETLSQEIDKARAALAAPPRNCDIAQDWLHDLYVYFNPPASVKREMPPEWVDAVMAFCRWLVAPATKKEGGNK